MMPDPRPRVAERRLHGDEVEPHRKVRECEATRQHSALEQRERGGPQPPALAMVDRLLGEAVVPPNPPADLDEHQFARRARVDRHEIKLVATDMDVPGQDGPAVVDQLIGNQRFGGITRLLGRRPRTSWRPTVHAAIIATRPARPINRNLPADCALGRGQLERVEVGEVRQIERRVVGHDRQELPLEDVVGRRRG